MSMAPQGSLSGPSRDIRSDSDNSRAEDCAQMLRVKEVRVKAKKRRRTLSGKHI
jgi:hypothetical protein